MTEDKDIRIIALKCPNCGGALNISPGSDRTTCGHCGGDILLIRERDERTGTDAVRAEATMSEEATKRVFKIALWGTAISVALPIITTGIILIVIALVFLFLGLVFVGPGR